MKNILFHSIILLQLLLSCSKQHKQPSVLPLIPVEINGYVVPDDSMAKPKVVLAGKPKIIFAGNPKVVYTNTNVYPAGEPKVYIIGKPRIITPGQDTFLLPKIVPAIEKHILAGIPEVVISKDAYIKEQNPESFKSFSKLQGLNDNSIRCITQDVNGNVWFGTNVGGISKYDGKYFTHYTENEGLIKNRVRCMVQDKTGNIWIGTSDGVSKFDGKYFTNYSTKQGLCHDIVRCAYQDSDGNMWFGTNGGGLSKFDGKTFTYFTGNQGLANNKVLCIAQDKNGNLWFGTEGGGVSKYNGKTFTQFTKNEGLNDNIVKSIIESKDGHLWFGTNEGVSEYDGKSFKQYTIKEGLSNNVIRCILQDQNGNLWFGTEGGGVSKYDGKTFTYYTENDGLSNNNVISILQDRNGNIWLGTEGGGISLFEGNVFSHFSKGDLLGNYVTSILKDKSGNIWIGSDGGGVSKFDGRSFTHYTDKEGLSNNIVLCIFLDNNENLWFGTFGGGVSKYDGKTFTNYSKSEGLSSNNIYDIIQDRDGNFWFATYGGGVSKFDGKYFTHYTINEGLSSNIVWCIDKDKNENIWFGTDNGVTKFDLHSFTHFTKKEGFSHDIVNSILVEDNGNLWFGSDGGGVLKYDGKYFTQFTEKDELCNNSVMSILKDRNGNLWFGTHFGLSKLGFGNLALLKPEKHNTRDSFNYKQSILFKNFTYDNGFLGIGCNRGAICEVNNGSIWIGASEKLTVYHPNEDLEDTIPPTIQLTSIDLYNEKIPWVSLEQKKDTLIILGNGVILSNFHFNETTRWYGLPINLSLRYNNNFLTFKYIGITQKHCKKVKYQYKLEGLDKNWSAPILQNEVSYGNLPHGNYSFRVKAMNSEGYWSREFSYSFTIRPPWWKTIFSKILFVLLFSSFLLIVYRWRISTLQAQKKYLEKIVKEKTIEVVEKNEELETINEELTARNEELFQQREELDATLHSLKNTQKQLVQSEKMASLGVLASGIAHEINNPLNFIHGGIAGIEQYFNENLSEHKPNVEFYINGINEGVKSAVDIVLGLNHYSRSGDFISKEINTHTLIDNCLLILQNSTKNRIKINCNYTDEPFTLVGNEGKLHQAIMNIILNSIQAIEDKGIITINTSIHEEKIIISISDTGCGISEGNLTKILDPFFTTKDPGQGTGLGLSITYTIIKEHNGTIEFESELGKGTTAIISLPLSNTNSF